MQPMEIARKIMRLCEEVRNVEAVDTLFADDVVSVEAMDIPGSGREMRGIAQVREKNASWVASREVHSVMTFGPWPNGDRFIIGFTFDTTEKTSGVRRKVDVAGLYTVSKGKVVREEFFYDLGQAG